jgi:hypothetical protein
LYAKAIWLWNIGSTYPSTFAPSAFFAVSRDTSLPAATSLRYGIRSFSLTIVAAPRWCTTATSVSHELEPDFCCAESFS